MWKRVQNKKEGGLNGKTFFKYSKKKDKCIFVKASRKCQACGFVQLKRCDTFDEYEGCVIENKIREGNANCPYDVIKRGTKSMSGEV
jgi:hypothetical protein